MNEENNVVLIPMAVPKNVFAVLNRIAIKKGKSANELFAEIFKNVFNKLVVDELPEGEER